MGCNKDSKCLKLAVTVYPALEEKINTSAKIIDENLSELLDQLNSLYVPDDYLGNKVKDNLIDICKGLNDDKESINTLTKKVNEFISGKIIVHRKHYNDWQRQWQEKQYKKPLNKPIAIKD